MGDPSDMTMDEVLAAADRKHGHGGVFREDPAAEIVFALSPSEEIERREESEQQEEWAIRCEAFFEFLGFVFQEGPHPADVARRLYAFAKAFAPELVLTLGVRELGRLLGEAPGARKWRAEAVSRGKCSVLDMDEVLGAVFRKKGHGGVFEVQLIEEFFEAWAQYGVREWDIRRETFRLSVEFVFGDGSGVDDTLRRLFALVKAMKAELIFGMGVRDLGKLFGESHGTWSWRCKAVVHDFVKARLGQNIHLPYQKSAESCQKYSVAQQDNRNRKNGEKNKRLKRLNGEG